MDKSVLMAWLPKLSGRRIVVVGDLFLDEYIVGRPTRLSREAPVPVIEMERRFGLPGAAANPANNVQTLGGQAMVVGVVGKDEAGATLCDQLRKLGVDTTGVVVDPSRPTTTKTRVVAEDSSRVRQQIVRIDRQDRRGLDAGVVEQLTSHIASAISSADALLVSDYKGGVVCQEVVAASLAWAQRGQLLTVDSQGDPFAFRGFGLVRANEQEIQAALGVALTCEEDFQRLCHRLLGELDTRAVVITRGIDGMSVAGPEGYAHLPAANRSEVFDVTGAGDTVIAVLTLTLAAGAPLLAAAHLANFAAGLVVRKLGNATTTPAELRSAILSAPTG